MTIVVTCTACHYQFRVDSQHAGKLIRCPDCRVAVPVPSEVSPSTSSPSLRSVRGTGSLSQEMPRRTAGSGSQPAVRATTRASRRAAPIDPNRYKAPVSPIRIVAIVAGGIFTVGLLALVAFRLGQGGSNSDEANNTSQNTDSAETGATQSDSIPGRVPGDLNSADATPPANPPELAAGSGTNIIPTPPHANASMSPERRSSAADSPAPTTPSTADGLANAPLAAAPDLAAAVVSAAPIRNPVPESPQPPTTQNPISQPTTPAEELALADLIERVDPSIVRVDIVTQRGSGHGSGFIVDASGIVVTNYHVVETGSRGSVAFKSGLEIPIEGYLYLNHRTDIAILKINPDKSPVPLKPVPLASELPRKGEGVVAFGAPLGLDFTASDGMVSAIRDASDLKESIGLADHSGTWIQTTAPISPGNSGGPLVNRRGSVVAINTLTMSVGQNLNFAISAVDIQDAMKNRSSVVTPMSPEAAPSHDGVPLDEFDERSLVDAIGTERGERLLREIKSVMLIRRAFTYDVLGTVTSAVDSEARNALTKAGIRESITANSAMIVMMTLKSAGNGSRLWITSQLVVRERMGGRDQAVMVWEKTGEVGSISDQALFSGNLPMGLKKDISDFFRGLRVDIMNARKAVPKPADGGDDTNKSPGDAKAD